MLVQTRADYERAVRAIGASRVVSLDLETTGLFPFEGDRITTVSVGTDGAEWVFPFRLMYLAPGTATAMDPDAFGGDVGRNLPEALMAPLFRVLATRPITMHKAAFDTGFIRREFPFFPAAIEWDTKTAQWISDENALNGLKDIGARMFGADAVAENAALKTRLTAIRRAQGKGSVPWAALSPHEMSDYATMDARLTRDVRLRQELSYITGDYLSAFRREMALQPILLGMFEAGVAIDMDVLDAIERDLVSRLAALKGELGYSPGVRRELEAQLYDEWGFEVRRWTPTGQRATDAAALAYAAEDHPGHEGIAALMRYRAVEKYLGTYVRGFKARTGQDGRVHSIWKGFGTVTGRLASEKPNQQNIPQDYRHPELPSIRSAFRATPGFVLAEYDLGQAELRMAAALAREDRLQAAFDRGDDVHTLTAMAIFGEAGPASRRRAKNLNFGQLYEIGPAKFALTSLLGGEAISLAQASEWGTKWHARYPGIKRASLRAQMTMRRRGSVNLWVPGRVRRIPDGRFAYRAFNALVQGGVGEVMKEAMLALAPEADAFGARLVAQVHDSFVYEVERGAVEAWGARVSAAVAAINPYGVQLPVDGKAWDHG